MKGTEAENLGLHSTAHMAAASKEVGKGHLIMKILTQILLVHIGQDNHCLLVKTTVLNGMVEVENLHQIKAQSMKLMLMWPSVETRLRVLQRFSLEKFQIYLA